MVKTPEAMRFYALAIKIEKMLKKKKIDIQQRMEIRTLMANLCSATEAEVSNILTKGENDESKWELE